MEKLKIVDHVNYEDYKEALMSEADGPLEINHKNYYIVNPRISRKYYLHGNAILINKDEILYKVTSFDTIYNDLKIHIKEKLNKHPHWANWCAELDEIKKIKGIEINEEVSDNSFSLDYGVIRIYSVLNGINELDRILKENYQILRKYINPLKLNKDSDLEFCLDKFQQIIHDHKIKKFTYSFVSKKHKFLIDENVIRKFDYIKELIDKKKIDKSAISNFITKKINKMNTSTDMMKIVDEFIADVTGYSLDRKIKELKDYNVEIIYKSSEMIIAEVDTFEKMERFGSNQWCIAQSEGYFKQYLSQHKEMNRQFVLWDYSKKPDDPYSMIGFTINLKDEIKASHLKNDMVTPVEYREIIKNRIPLLSEDAKFNILLEISDIKEDLLMNSLKYCSEKGFDFAKKEIRYRSTDEDKVSVLIMFAREMLNKTMSGSVKLDEAKLKVVDFIKDITIKNIERRDIDRILTTNNLLLIDFAYEKNKDYTLKKILDHDYTSVEFLKYVYDNYLIDQKINRNIKKAITGCFEVINLDKKRLKDFSKNELINILSNIINKKIKNNTEQIIDRAQEKDWLKSGLNLAIENTKKELKLNVGTRYSSYFRIENILNFASMYNINLDKNEIKDLMSIAIKYNIESDVEPMIKVHNKSKIKLLEKDINNLNLVCDDIMFISKIHKLEDIGWISYLTRRKFIREE